jgi:histidyl-tRNA synthetase
MGGRGIEEMRTLFAYLDQGQMPVEVELDLTLARGLNYYTGTIFEVKSKQVSMGSICGGGRYDDLTGIFGMPGVSGVGISFGADRIYDVMLELNNFPPRVEMGTRVLFVNFGPEEEAHILPILKELRQGGIPAEIYPDAAKMPKQMKYAHARGIPFVALVGEKEMQEGRVTLKDMDSGQQESFPAGSLLSRLTL